MDNVLFAWPCLGLPLALPWFGLVPFRGIVFQFGSWFLIRRVFFVGSFGAAYWPWDLCF